MDEHTIDVSGTSVFLRRASGPTADVLYLHSVPTSSDDWSELLTLTGGVAPDLPGFGRSDKPGHLDLSLTGQVTFVDSLLRALQLPPVAIVGHGWGGAIAVCLAQAHPARVRRLALLNPVPLLPGFVWPRPARWWRRPVAGELLMGSINRRWLARGLRRGSARPRDAWPDSRVDAVWEQFDQGTQRAILRLHRSVDARRLAELGAGLPALEQPTLIVWGEQDPWLPAEFADAYAPQLPNARVERAPGAGHWPWLDEPALRATIAEFVATRP